MMEDFTTIKDIVQNNLCTGCGVCLSESNTNGSMIWNNEGFLVPNIDGHHNEIKVCPFNPNPEKAIQDEDVLSLIYLKDANRKDHKIGRFINTYVGYSSEYRETSSSGGIATFIFEYLLRAKMVDHLFIVKEINGTYEYALFSQADSIKQISKTRYIPVTLEKLFLEIDSIEGTIAVSGVACFIKAIRLKQHYNPKLKEKIPFVIGIICGGLKSKFFTDYLAESAGITSGYSKQEYRIKDASSTAGDYSFGAFDSHQSFHQMKMKKVGDMWGTGLFKSNACDFCDDVMTELADISLGDAWIPPYNRDGLGNSIIVTRSKLAETIIKEGIKDGTLHVEELSLEKAIDSQAGSFKHRQLGIKYRLKRLEKKSPMKPFKRSRFFENIPFEYQWVQNQRMDLRKNSLLGWLDSKDSSGFEESILVSKDKLIAQTRFYHRMQKLRRMLKLKTL